MAGHEDEITCTNGVQYCMAAPGQQVELNQLGLRPVWTDARQVGTGGNMSVMHVDEEGQGYPFRYWYCPPCYDAGRRLVIREDPF